MNGVLQEKFSSIDWLIEFVVSTNSMELESICSQTWKRRRRVEWKNFFTVSKARLAVTPHRWLSCNHHWSRCWLIERDFSSLEESVFTTDFWDAIKRDPFPSNTIPIRQLSVIVAPFTCLSQKNWTRSLEEFCGMFRLRCLRLHSESNMKTSSRTRGECFLAFEQIRADLIIKPEWKTADVDAAILG